MSFRLEVQVLIAISGIAGLWAGLAATAAPFGAAGNQKALAALKASKKEDDLKVEVTGEIEGDTIKIASLKLL